MEELNTVDWLVVDLWNKVNNHELPRFLYRYMTLEYIEDIICKNRLKFSSPKEFNDPFDCLATFGKVSSYTEILSHISKINGSYGVKHSMDALKNKAREMFRKQKEFQSIIRTSANKAFNESKICCFSELWDNILMWSHYTDGHNGLVLKFDVLKDPYFFIATIKMNYSKIYPTITSLENIGPSVVSILTTKFDIWEYEREVRLIKFDDLMSGSFLSFKKEALCEIIFGCKTKHVDLERIVGLTKNNGYKDMVFKKVELKEKEYGLELGEIKIN